MKWASGPHQLADSLTKEGADPSYLRWVLSHAQYQLHRDTDLQSKISKTLDEMQDNETVPAKVQEFLDEK